MYKTLVEYDSSFSLCGAMINFPEQLDVSILPVECKRYVDPALKFFTEIQHNPKFCDSRSFIDYLNELRERIGSEYRQDYKEVIVEFLKEKERVKNTDTLLRLANL